ncbi:MAG TPA: MotA/TolQ/ExbB proton channel family protein, partial [Gammaproteobacteria bacterium]|nr:MotA/TolQ/ExbB proton channel family protein [Gammaproteobacteria bacterium]
METLNTIIGFFQTGGLFMYPILFILAAGIAIGIERYLYLGRVQKGVRKTWEQVVPLVQAKDYKGVVNATGKSDSALAKVLNYGFNRVFTSTRRDDIETAMEEGLMEVIPALEKRTHYLATFANIATLLGLLGTIIGLIQAFTAVANADPAEKANLLSASISVAMNTTAFGLMVAIPLLLVYTVIQTKTTEIVDSLEMAAV